MEESNNSEPQKQEQSEDSKEIKEDKNSSEDSKEIKEDKNSTDNCSKGEEEVLTSEIKVLPEDYAAYDLIFKIIIIGNSGVGKSSLAEKAVREKFDTAYQATVGFDFFSMFIKIKDKVIKLQIWDTCGQEVYRSLIKSFYRNASFALMMYAVNNIQSFNDIDLWIKEVKTCSSPDSKIILIGNKADLENERQVTKEMGKSCAEKYEFIDFFETSALTGFNTQEVFIKAAKILYKDYLTYKSNDVSEGSISSYERTQSTLTGKENKTGFLCC